MIIQGKIFAVPGFWILEYQLVSGRRWALFFIYAVCGKI